MSFLRRDIEEWGEENGSPGRCPRCHKRIWMESGCFPECYHCGYGSEEDEPDEEDDEPEHHDNEKDEPRGDGRYNCPDWGISEADFR